MPPREQLLGARRSHSGNAMFDISKQLDGQAVFYFYISLMEPEMLINARVAAAPTCTDFPYPIKPAASEATFVATRTVSVLKRGVPAISRKADASTSPCLSITVVSYNFLQRKPRWK